MREVSTFFEMKAMYMNLALPAKISWVEFVLFYLSYVLFLLLFFFGPFLLFLLLFLFSFSSLY